MIGLLFVSKWDCRYGISRLDKKSNKIFAFFVENPKETRIKSVEKIDIAEMV